ncbi:unnamed protein product, partial [Meganyctiphanes norvegica]
MGFYHAGGFKIYVSKLVLSTLVMGGDPPSITVALLSISQQFRVLTGCVCIQVDLFATVGFSIGGWFLSDVLGDTRLGLLWTCETLYNRKEVCYSPSLGGAWLVTLACVLLGCACVTATVVLLALSHCRLTMHVMTYARWLGFTAMVLFCLAAVVFPMGFYVEEIGGEPYQLPNSFQVGYSYIFFVLALWMTVVSELFAGKVCLPHF